MVDYEMPFDLNNFSKIKCQLVFNVDKVNKRKKHEKYVQQCDRFFLVIPL